MRTGKVYLVGAGPGDPLLLTRKGARCLERADVVVYDRLVDPSLLDLAPPQAERIFAGKQPGGHTMGQAEINRLLVEKADEGKVVVRLKGGDPFVFGRGGEEAEFLRSHGIPFEVVSGVTSAVAVPAYAGIPVTHRGVASSVTIVTGHEDESKPASDVCWERLAGGADTLVILMGMGRLEEIVSALCRHGRPPRTPVAIIKDGTTPRQRVITGTLADIVAKAASSAFEAPAVIVVGEVVKLREKLGWFDRLPLFGRRVLVLRARHQADTLCELLLERGAQPVALPAIEIRAESSTELDRAISNLRKFHWIVFTSANGVVVFFDGLHRHNLDARALGGVRIGAIGPATAEALRGYGITADIVPEVHTTMGLAEKLAESDVGGKHVLLPRADIADKELGRRLARLGATVHDLAIYRTLPARETLLRARESLIAGGIDIIVFTSSSMVAGLVAAFEGDVSSLSGVVIACIGEKTADEARKAGLRVDVVSRDHTVPDLVDAIEDYFRRRQQ
ncbi:MAG: uroporphyrinogen-III C-methyltransferase [Dehalococcoidales bacterium]|nr:uroporphyrinogen-III C-methyltransferase [Dehalococcoidales bacterium]